MEKSLTQEWEEIRQIAKNKNYGCKNCKNRNKGAENDFVEFCLINEQEMPKESKIGRASCRERV